MVCVQNFRGLLNCRVSLNTVYANSKIRRPLCLTVFFRQAGSSLRNGIEPRLKENKTRSGH